MTRSPLSRERLAASFAAGLVAGCTISAFAAFAQWRAGRTLAQTYTFITSVAVGDQASRTSWAVPAGIALLFAGSVLWAIGYLTLARRQPQLLSRPLISGLGFGVVVWFAMLAVLIPVGKFQQPTIYTFDRDIVGFTLFFGVPLALVAARLMRAP